MLPQPRGKHRVGLPDDLLLYNAEGFVASLFNRHGQDVFTYTAQDGQDTV